MKGSSKLDSSRSALNKKKPCLFQSFFSKTAFLMKISVGTKMIYTPLYYNAI